MPLIAARRTARAALPLVALLFLVPPVRAQTLSTAQQQTLATDIAANNATINGTAIKNLAHTPDNAFAVAQFYNQSAAYLVWRTEAPVNDILDNITWTNYTPNDAADNTVTYQNRAMLVQIKQINLQMMLQGRASFNAAKSTLRGGLNDATLNLPTGASGVSRSGGWANVVTVLRRNCTNAEKLFVTTATGVGNDGVAGNRGTATNPDLMTFEGSIGDADVRGAWGI